MTTVTQTMRPSIHPGETIDAAHERTRTTLKELGAYQSVNPNARFQNFVFRNTQHRRHQIIAALEEARKPQIAERMSDCCSKLYLYRHQPTASYATRANSCGYRWCPNCGPVQVYMARRRVLENLPPPQHRLSFLTLTQPAVLDRPLGECIRNIRTAFTRLRKTDLWHKYVSAGVYVLEITLNNQTGWYHVHIHAIIDARYIPDHQLQDAWSEALRTPAILNLSAVDNPLATGRYLASYMAKPLPDELYADHARLASALSALVGVPTMKTFGAWHGLHLATRDRQAAADAAGPLDEWQFIGDIDLLVFRARSGSTLAAQHLRDAGYGEVLPTLLDRPQTKPRPPPWLFNAA